MPRREATVSCRSGRRAVFLTVLETDVGNAGLSEGLLVYHDMEGVCL